MGAEITRFVRESVRAFVREMLEIVIQPHGMKHLTPI